MEQKIIQSELRRSRSRRKKAAEARETVICNILAFCIGLVVFFFFGVIWLTDPAYAESLYPEETFQIDSDEYMDLALLLAGEAQAEPYEGQMAVVEVIANRVIDPGFPGTFHGVMSQRGQFGAWKDRKDKTVMQAQIDAINEVAASEESVFRHYIDAAQAEGRFRGVRPKDYVYFGTREDYEKVGYKYMHNLIRIGKHIFGTR